MAVGRGIHRRAIVVHKGRAAAPDDPGGLVVAVVIQRIAPHIRIIRIGAAGPGGKTMLVGPFGHARDRLPGNHEHTHRAGMIRAGRVLKLGSRRAARGIERHHPEAVRRGVGITDPPAAAADGRAEIVSIAAPIPPVGHNPAGICLHGRHGAPIQPNAHSRDRRAGRTRGR